jgi:hypothetical protein
MNISMGCFVTQRVRLLDSNAIPQVEESSDQRRIEMMIALLLPLSSDELNLASRDPKVQPVLDYNYLADTFDRERLREGGRGPPIPQIGGG